MPETLTVETLHGVWAAVPTPWDEDGELDEDVLRQDTGYLCRQGFHGIYTTSSSGEFFALTLDEFRVLTSAVLEEARRAGVPVQVGCGAADTESALRQARHAVERGASAIQVVLPFYQKIGWDEALRFFRTMAAVCGQVPLVHYNTAHAGLTLEPGDYRRLKDEIPTLIGTKLPRGEPLWFAAVCEAAPDLSHFTGEYTLVADLAAGGRGLYSWLALTNPRLTLAWVGACRSGNWNEAVRLQRLVSRYKIHVKRHWRGSSDAAINKADAKLNPNMRCSLHVRPPYTSCTEEDLERARSWAGAHFPELLDLG